MRDGSQPVDFEFRPADRIVWVPKPTREDEAARFPIRIPTLFGAIHSVEQRGRYLVVRTAAGKASYHLVRKHGNLGAPNSVGFMVWNSLRKTILDLCLEPRFVARIDVHVIYFRNGLKGGSGGSANGVVGRVLADKRVVEEGNELGFALGPALETYLHVESHELLGHRDRIVRAFALLDRKTQTEPVMPSQVDLGDPLWRAFHELRKSA